MIGLTRGPAWKINYEGGDSAAIDRSRSFGNGGFAAISGLPHLTIPFFKIDNFPVGLSINWSDKKVLEIGAFLERQKKIDFNYLISSNGGCKVFRDNSLTGVYFVSLIALIKHPINQLQESACLSKSPLIRILWDILKYSLISKKMVKHQII